MIDAINQAKANLDVILDVISRAIVLGGAHGRSGRGRMVVVCALRAPAWLRNTPPKTSFIVASCSLRSRS